MRHAFAGVFLVAFLLILHDSRVEESAKWISPQLGPLVVAALAVGAVGYLVVMRKKGSGSSKP